MKVSYLITYKDEDIHKLLLCLASVQGKDEIVLLQDSQTIVLPPWKEKKVSEYHYSFIQEPKIYPHLLNNDYGAHKNFGIEKCNGNFIFQLDGDELPPDSLLGE